MTRQDGNPEDVLMQWQMHLILIDSNSAKCKAKYIANSKSIDLASVSTSDQDLGIFRLPQARIRINCISLVTYWLMTSSHVSQDRPDNAGKRFMKPLLPDDLLWLVVRLLSAKWWTRCKIFL